MRRQVYAVFSYMNDVYSEITERESYEQLTAEIGYMDQHIPELKGMKAIWQEFMPAMQTAVGNKAVSFVQMVHTNVFAQVMPPSRLVFLTLKLYAKIWTISWSTLRN